MKILCRYVCAVIYCLLFVSAGFAGDDPLTPEERAWLTRHDGQIILGAEPGWPPISFFDDNGEYSGISVHYVRLIERRLGFRFKIKKMASFEDILDKARSNRIDVIMEIVSTPERTQYLSFTEPYLKIPSVIITRSIFTGSAVLADMDGKKVFVPAGFAVIDFLNINYPELQLIPVTDPAEGLRRLSTGENDAMILELPAASYLTEKEGLTNLRVAGFTGHEYSLGIGSRKDLPFLNRILEKGLAMISPAERDSIYREWVHLEYRPLYLNKIFIIVAAAVLGIIILLFSAILVWNRTLKTQVRARTQDLQNELNRRRQAEANLHALFQTIPDLIWLKDVNGVYLSCNRMFERFFGASERDIIGKTDYYFVNRELADFFREHDQRAMAAGRPSGNEEWLTFADDGYHGLFDTIKTPMYDSEGNLIGVLGISRDITERKRADEALHSNEQHLKSIVDGSPIPQFVIDKNHRIIHWNRALEEYSGIRTNDVIGTNQQWRAFYSYERPCIADLLVDGSMDMIPQWYSGKYSHSRLIKDAFEAIDFFPAMKGGTWLYFTAAPLNDTDGVIIGAVETLVDITDQKRAEQALKFNAERAETLLKINQMIDAPVSDIMNYAFEEAVRFTRSEIGYLGLMNDDETDMEVHVWSSNVMPECKTQDKSIHFPVKTAGLWGEAVRQRKPIITNNYNDPSPWKKGCPEGHIPIKRHMNIPIIAGKKIVLLAGVGNKTDEYDENDVQHLTLLMEGMWRIIERNRTEQELRDSQSTLTDIIAFLPDATLVVDKNDRVIAWNRAIENMTGVRAEDMLGKGNFEYAIPFYGERRPILVDLILHPEPDMEKHYTTIHRVGNILFGEAFTPSLPGGEAYLSATSSVLRDSAGDIIAAIECIRDNTEQKKAEENRKKLEDQLVQAQKMEAVGRLAGGVAHDFNNMLTPIMGYAEMLKRGLPNEDPRQIKLNEIIRASERSRDLVRQLLAFARKQTLEMNLVDLNMVITGFENMLRRTLHENIHLEINLTSSIGSILADVGQIEQVILNLAVNAQDAMPEGGNLFISTSTSDLDEIYTLTHEEVNTGCYVKMEITDTGEGIDKETCKRIFEPFFSTKGVMGTGLGLATVYGIVKQHGGHISVYSETGSGTTFKVYFPKFSESVPFSEPSSESETPLHGRETLIVVEDQEQVRTMTVDILRDYGYQVLEAANINDAIRIAAFYQDDIHLLITDVILPDGNGRELYEKIRVERTGIRILYMSGYPSNVIMHHGVLEPGVQFIQKPFSIIDFTKKIREVLG